MWDVRSALLWSRRYLKKRGITTPSLDAEVLLAFVLKWNRSRLYQKWEHVLADKEIMEFRALIVRRGKKEPVAYLTGKKEFMELELEINNLVLIPRPETELLVETALNLFDSLLESLPPFSNLQIVDVGTGSGAIAIALAKYLPAARIFAIDVSPDALAVAQRNANTHKVAEQVSFFQGRLLEPLEDLNLDGKIDLIVANLPYIPTAKLSELPPEVYCYEPLKALDGGFDGLEHYRQMVPKAYRFLREGGYLLMEIGNDQRQSAIDLVLYPAWHSNVYLDLAGHERLVVAEKRVKKLQLFR